MYHNLCQNLLTIFLINSGERCWIIRVAEFLEELQYVSDQWAIAIEAILVFHIITASALFEQYNIVGRNKRGMVSITCIS